MVDILPFPPGAAAGGFNFIPPDLVFSLLAMAQQTLPFKILSATEVKNFV